jgi:transposase
VVNRGVLVLVACVVERCEGQRQEHRRGHPRAETVRVLATLRRFLREGTPWRSLRASDAEVSGSTLRRALARWAETGVLGRTHAMLVQLLRGRTPELIVDSSSVRAKRGGDLTGPNPTDRAKRGSKYHVAVTGEGIPVACAVTGANVPDTVLFARLFRAALAVMARIRTAYADRGYDAEGNRALCRRHGTLPCIGQRRHGHGSGLGRQRWPVERTNAWIGENRRLALRYDRLGFVIEALLQAACIFLVAPRLAQEL